MKLILTGILGLLICLLFVGSSYQEEYRCVYGVRISTGANSQLISFVARKYDAAGYLKSQRYFTNKDEFIKVISGYWPSPFNPQKVNYFEMYDIFGGVYVDDTTKAVIPYCSAIDSLWKIRFSDWPHHGYNEPGWSTNRYRPGLKQEEYLSERYGIKQLDFDFIVDTSFWKLLKDVSNPNWVENYKSLY